MGLLGILSWGHPRLRSVGRGIALAALVGVIAGVGAVLFHVLTRMVGYLALERIAGYAQGGPAGEAEFIHSNEVMQIIPWLLVLVPAVGGLISGWLVYRFAPEAEGHGTDAAIEAYHHKRGEIRPRVPLVKMIASAVTLGTGGSGGREGPIAQIGAGFGSLLATKLGLSVNERRVLLAAGVGAGIAAIFHAPLAGAIFAIEVMYRDPDFEAEALIPAFIACTIAYCVFSLTLSLTLGVNAFHPLFAVLGGIEFQNPALLLPLTVLAVVMVGASWMYVRTFYGVHQVFKKLPMPQILKPALGGLLTGLIGLVGYLALGRLSGPDAGHNALGVLSAGYGYLQEVLQLETSRLETIWPLVGLLLFVGLGKILTTSLTISSGGSGGVFGPSMVIGGTLGAVVGLLGHLWLPNMISDPEVVMFAILGMASFFAASASTPVSTLIMVSELTSSYELLVPSMWVCALAYLLSRGWSIYTQQVQNRLESPAHRGDFIIDILEGLTIADAMTPAARQFVTVPLATPLRDVVHMITDNRQSTFPVVDEQGKYIGAFGLHDVRQFLYDTDMGELATAEDLALPTEPLVTDTALGEAIGRFADTSLEELPVVDPDSPRQIRGMMRRVDIIAAYNSRLLKMRSTPPPSNLV
jgi:CIC family chloride channel protein